ncbi:uncharacterized protein [Epargyreus clarus]|uniref:uncharacterized protein n=1 Tax=Epargyreus clarus TaxID=520877 RepID=UPI003C2C23DD
MSNRSERATVVCALVVFALPLTLLIPNFSLWDLVPKIKVTRFHILSQHLTWPQLNAAAIGLLGILFCIYLEIRKRKLDDMVENVLRVSQATDTTMGVERVRQAVAVRACVELLDASAEHYEHLALLRDELRRRDAPRLLQHPPAIEPSTSNVAPLYAPLPS